MSLAGLANHVASIPNQGVAILTTDEMDVATRQRPAPKTTAAELVALFDETAGRMKCAQLGVFLRLLDVPIPGIYGPSADEPIS